MRTFLLGEARNNTNHRLVVPVGQVHPATKKVMVWSYVWSLLECFNKSYKA
jgi:hypothetical protein